MLVNPTLKNIHYKELGNENFEPIIDVLWGDLTPLDDLPNAKASRPQPLQPQGHQDASRADDFERNTLARFLKSATDEDALAQDGQAAREALHLRRRHADVGRAGSRRGRRNTSTSRR